LYIKCIQRGSGFETRKPIAACTQHAATTAAGDAQTHRPTPVKASFMVIVTVFMYTAVD